MKKAPIIGIVPLIDCSKNSYWMLPGYFGGIIEAGGLLSQGNIPENADLGAISDVCEYTTIIILAVLFIGLLLRENNKNKIIMFTT